MNNTQKRNLKIYKVYAEHCKDEKNQYIVKIIDYILQNYENPDIEDVICNIKLTFRKAYNKNLPHYKQEAIAEILQLLENIKNNFKEY